MASLAVWFLLPLMLGVAWGASPSPPPADQPPAANGQGRDSSGQSKTISNDKTNYVGDRISFSRDMIVTAEAADQTVKGKICLPAKWLLRGGTAYTANSADGKGTPETGTRFTLIKPPGSPVFSKPKKGSKGKDSESVTPKSDDSTACGNDLPDKFDNSHAALVAPGTVIRVTSQQLQDSPPDRLGLAFGLLTVPLKYHLTGAKDITGSASVGPYVGYRTDNEGYGYGITFIGFLAASNISVPTQTSTGNPPSDSQSTHNLFGLSYGVGAVATIKGSFQAGLVIGADRVSKSENYQYNGKPWLAVMIGYDFLQ
jgi:hypothetical protein